MCRRSRHIEARNGLSPGMAGILRAPTTGGSQNSLLASLVSDLRGGGATVSAWVMKTLRSRCAIRAPTKSTRSLLIESSAPSAYLSDQSFQSCRFASNLPAVDRTEVFDQHGIGHFRAAGQGETSIARPLKVEDRSGFEVRTRNGRSAGHRLLPDVTDPILMIDWIRRSQRLFGITTRFCLPSGMLGRLNSST